MRLSSASGIMLALVVACKFQTSPIVVRAQAHKPALKRGGLAICKLFIFRKARVIDQGAHETSVGLRHEW